MSVKIFMSNDAIRGLLDDVAVKLSGSIDRDSPLGEDLLILKILKMMLGVSDCSLDVELGDEVEALVDELITTVIGTIGSVLGLDEHLIIFLDVALRDRMLIELKVEIDDEL